MTPILREASSSPCFHKNIIVERTLQQSTGAARSAPSPTRCGKTEVD
jgi:hypothetical protein